MNLTGNRYSSWRCVIGSTVLLVLALGANAAAPEPEVGASNRTVASSSGVPAPIKDDRVADLLPSNKLFSDEEIIAGFDRLGITPLDNPAMRFELYTPKPWESEAMRISPETLAADNEQLIPLARIAPTNAEQAGIEVQYIRAPESVTLKRILDIYTQGTGYAVVVEKEAVFMQRKVHDALLKLDAPGFGMMYTRFTLSRHGDKIYVVACSCPENQYDAYKKIFGAAAVSFHLVNEP